MPTDLLDQNADGFVDLRFDAELLPPARPDTCRVRLLAHHDGRDVGLLVEVATDLVPGLRGVEIVRSAFRRDAVTFRSDGERTDRLVASLARATGVVPLGLPTRDTLRFTAFPLQEEPVDPLRAPCKLKLFHDDQVERGEYAEAFLNLDLPEGRVALNEKDPDYRPYWVRAWSVSPSPWSRITLALDSGPTLAQVEPADIRRELQAVARGARRAVLSDVAGESLIVARTSEGLGLLASLPTASGEARWGRTHLSSGDAERVVLSWAADGTLASDGWEDVAWEQVAAMFGPASTTAGSSTEGPLDG